MTNEKFEQILQRALAPEINDVEIQVKHRKARLYDMKAIYKITAAAACAALILGIGIVGNTYLNDRSDAEKSVVSDTSKINNSSKVGNSFLLKAGAEEITPNKGVPLIVENQSSYSLGGSKDTGCIKYGLIADFFCEGEGIEFVTYSINKGAFAVIESLEPGGSLINSGKEYTGDCNFPSCWSMNLNKYSPESLGRYYYTEYTLEYDAQQSDSFFVNICGDVYNDDIYNKVYDLENTPEQKAEAYTELMKGVEIVCTVQYKDGTKESETVIIECETMTVTELGYPLASNDDPDRRIPVFVYKTK